MLPIEKDTVLALWRSIRKLKLIFGAEQVTAAHWVAPAAVGAATYAGQGIELRTVGPGVVELVPDPSTVVIGKFPHA